MARAIGYYTDCAQGQTLVNRFGEYSLDGLPQSDQAALLVALSGMVLAHSIGFDASTVLDAAADVLPEDYTAYCGDDLDEAIAILEDVTPDDAIRVIRFLTQ
jgi:hypothetical protein